MQTLQLLFVIPSLGMMAIAIPLMARRIKPNVWYGFRTPTTLRDEGIWYEANAYAGRWLLAVGAVGVVAAIGLALIPGLSEDGYAWAFLAVFGAAMAVMLLASFRYLNRLKSQT